MIRFFAITSLLLLLSPLDVGAEEPVDYARDVKPILTHRCYACHGALAQESDLRLDTAAAARAGGESGPVIVAGSPADSLLIERITEEDASARMPPEGKPLTAQEISLLTAWIQQGAPAPANEQPPQDPRSHWSYQTPQRPTLPVAANAKWVRNPVDAFIAAKHRALGLTPRPAAEKHTLLRRVYLDLIGLPPTPGQLASFAQDTSPDAYERIVDRLLASPQYGERWGRHWMDIWRYSDWYGSRGIGEIRYSQKHIWRWRDWIVESLNADKGYDRMLVEMLAGDELAPGNPDILRATGFLGRNWYKFDRNVWLAETIERTSVGFLAVTMKCARCHDHKFDPISQREYYQLRAFFEPHDVRVDDFGGEESDNKALDDSGAGVARVYDAKPEAPTYLFIRGDDRNPDKEHPLAAATPAVLGAGKLKIAAVDLPLEEYYPALAKSAVERLIAGVETEVSGAENALAKARARLAVADQRIAKFANEKQLPDNSATSSDAAPFLADDFSTRQDDVWQPLSGNWLFADGNVTETTVGSFLAMTTQKNHPQDFQARIRYRTNDQGDTRSVGFSWDVVGPLKNWQAIYTHVSNGGSAVHACYRENGRDTYPQQAIISHPIKLNQEITLDFAVRGQLLNVWVDGELKLAYTMPLARQTGKFALWVHRGSASFEEVRIEPLKESFLLAADASQAIRSPFTPLTQKVLAQQQSAAAFAVTATQKQRTVAQTKRQSILARIAADRARILKSENAAPTALSAGRAERIYLSAAAEAALFKAEHELKLLQHAAKQSDAKSLAAAKTKRTAALKKRDAAKTALEKDSPKFTHLGQEYPHASTGRRLALARWMTDAANPRTARVAINHIWLRHFGRPLVDSVADFGIRSDTPSHPQLLDWLAVELIENRWSMKHIHRLLVTSNTYRMKSSSGVEGSANMEQDAANRFLWRMNSRRMEGEVVRDSLLACADQLDLQMGGPELADNTGQKSRRRSIYFRTTPDNKMPMLELFDLANPNECYRRKESVVPQQALAMMNSEVALTQARLLARRIVANSKSAAAEPFIVAAFAHVLSRQPTEKELAASLRFLQKNAALLQSPEKLSAFPDDGSGKLPPSSDPEIRARENLLHVLFSHNDFITIR